MTDDNYYANCMKMFNCSTQLPVDLHHKLQMALQSVDLSILWGVQYFISVTLGPLWWETTPLPAKMMEHGRTHQCAYHQVST